MLLGRIRDHTARVAVLGLGQAGLFQAYELAARGYEVVGYDVDVERVALVAKGESPVSDVPSSELATQVAGRRLVPTADPARLKDRHILLISVPTTLAQDSYPCVDEVRKAAQTIADHCAETPLVVVKSTGYPGLCQEVVAPILSRRFGEPGQGFYLAFVPERGDVGSRTLAGAAALPKVVAGMTTACSELAAALYREVGGPVHLASSLLVAEMVKLHENVYRFVNIAYVNEVASLCRTLGVDPFEVVDLAATKPFGFMPFRPGAGIGGQYLPINTAYLLWTAHRHGVMSRVLESAVTQNRRLPVEISGLVEGRLSDLGLSPTRARVVILGLGYKKGSGDVRGSPSLAVGEAVVALGAAVSGMDPHVRKRPEGLLFAWEEWDPVRLAEADLVVLVTDHDEFTAEILSPLGARLLDLRGVSRRWPANASAEAAATSGQAEVKKR